MSATITVVCPNCKNKMRASTDHIGRKGRCPACKSLVEIAAPEEAAGRTLVPLRDGGRARGSSADTTDVNSGMAALIGVAATAILYLAVFFPTRSTYFGELFVERGSVPYVTTWVACWGFAILALKYVAVKRQIAYTGLELELIPLEIGLQVTPDNIEQFLSHLGELPRDTQDSILARRIQGALEHFKFRNNVSEVQGYLSSQAEIDASGVDGGYTLLRSIIWAVPILGFIGTVMGISNAVAGLADAMPSAQTTPESSTPPGAASDIPADKPQKMGSQLMKAMGVVTAGLKTAFDTTLVALVLAIFLLFSTESLRKTEYGMLDRIEQFSNDSLLRRMVEREASSSASIGEAPEMVRDALAAAFQEHQRWLAQWQAQVAELGRIIGGEFESAVMRVQDRVGAAEKLRHEELQQAARAIDEMFARFGQTASQWEHRAEKSVRDVGASISASERLQTALAENAKLMAQVLEQELGLARQYSSGDLRESIQSLQQEVSRLKETAISTAAMPAPRVDRVAPLTALDDGKPSVDDSGERLAALAPVSLISRGDSNHEPVRDDPKGGLFGRFWGRR